MLGFAPISKKISLLFSGELDKALINVLSGHHETFIDEQNFHKLNDLFDNHNHKYTKTDAINGFLRYIDRNVEWTNALRILMVVHRLIHTQGEALSPIVNSKKTLKLTEFKIVKSSTKQICHAAILAPYLGYLQKLTHAYSDLHVCFTHDSKDLEVVLQKNNMSILHFLSKVQNMIRNLFKVFPLFEASVYALKAPILVKQALYYCLTDSYHLFSYVNKVIEPMLREIYDLTPEDAIFAFEIYCEHVQISNRLKSFFDLKNFLHEFHIQTPEFYYLNEEQNIDIELYIISLKRGSPKRGNNRKASVFGAESTTETKNFDVQTVSNEETERHNEPEKGYKSLQTVSKTWLQSLNSLSALPENTENNLYKLPKYSIRGKGPFKAPKIKVCRPKDKVKEEPQNRSPNKAMTLVTNNNLLQVPSENDCRKPVCILTIPVGDQHNNTFTNNKTDLESSLEQARMVPNGLLVPKFSPIPSPMAKGQCRSLNALGPESNLGGSFTDHTLGMREIHY